MQIHARTGSNLRCDNQACAKAEAYVCMYIDTFTRTHTLTRLCVWVCVFGRRPVHRCERAVLMAVCMYVHACVRVFNSLHTITHTDIM